MSDEPVILRVRWAPHESLVECHYRAEAVGPDGEILTWQRGPDPRVAIGNLVLCSAETLGITLDLVRRPGEWPLAGEVL